MFIDGNTSREELEVAIIGNDGLYARFDEQKLLGDGYTTEELRAAVVAWIEDGDECFRS